jgi:hypothetical protein
MRGARKWGIVFLDYSKERGIDGFKRSCGNTTTNLNGFIRCVLEVEKHG